MVNGRMPKKDKMVLYSHVGLFGVLALAGSLVADADIGYITTMISTILTGLFVASVLGRFWRRSTWQVGMAAIVAGSATSLTVQAVASWSGFWGSPVLPSLFMATVAGVLVSLDGQRSHNS